MTFRSRAVVTIFALILSAVSTAQTGTSSIRGRMVDSKVDRPISGVLVQLAPDPLDPVTHNFVPSIENLPNGRVNTSMWTDAQGRYVFEHLPAGNYRMKVEPPAAYAVTQDHDFKNASIGDGESVTVDWPLDPVVEVTGIVKNSSGGLMPRTPVKVEILNSQADAEVVTDDRGQFTVKVPAYCGLWVEVSAHGEASERHYDYPIEGEAKTIEISLHRGATVSGSVVDAHNRPLANASVQFRSGGHGRTDENGRFSIDNLMPGNYTVLVAPSQTAEEAEQSGSENLEQIVLRLNLKAGEQRTGLALMYNPAAEQTISGRLTDMDGNPLAKATMSWGSPEHGWAEFTQTRGDGTYTVRGLIDGDYHLVNIEYEGQYYESDAMVGVRKAAIGTKGADFKLKLAPPPPPEIPFEIRVKSAADGSPIRSFEVIFQGGVDRMFNAENFTNTEFLQRPPYQRVNDSRGVFTAGKRSGLAYSLAVRAQGYGLWVGLVETDDDSFTVMLEPEAWVRGRAVDRDGNPVAGAVIMYHSIFGNRMPEGDEMSLLGKTDGNGRFSLGGMPSSEIQLMFLHADYADTTVRVTPDRFSPPDDEIVMPRAGVLTGRIYLDGQLFMESSGVDYLDPETNPGYGIGGHMEKPDGTYRIGRLPAGDGTAKATIFPWVESKRQMQEATVTIVEGQSTTVDFRFSSAK